MNYRHLTLEQRYQIAALHLAEYSQQHIASTIGCHSSTISRELRRNRCGGHYAGPVADGQPRQRRHVASAARICQRRCNTNWSRV